MDKGNRESRNNKVIEMEELIVIGQEVEDKDEIKAKSKVNHSLLSRLMKTLVILVGGNKVDEEQSSSKRKILRSKKDIVHFK